jgi:hypothetical protein
MVVMVLPVTSLLPAEAAKSPAESTIGLANTGSHDFRS